MYRSGSLPSLLEGQWRVWPMSGLLNKCIRFFSCLKWRAYCDALSVCPLNYWTDCNEICVREVYRLVDVSVVRRAARRFGEAELSFPSASTDFLSGLLFVLEDGSHMFLWNVRLSPKYAASHPRAPRNHVLWESQIQHYSAHLLCDQIFTTLNLNVVLVNEHQDRRGSKIPNDDFRADVVT